ncbi:MAG: FAD-binding oxidoreductase [Gammaproteobacteria bacterium]|jgi:cytochrome-b5 reductase
MSQTVKILMTEFLTHDVKRFIVSKPEDFIFKPGQGVELAINQKGWIEETRPFTPTSLTDDRVLEFTIKSYPQHNGVTQKLHELKAGDELLLSEPFGTITYHGPGTFIAGGAGVTPFVAIFRSLARQNKLENNSLVFSNKTPADIICEKEFKHYLQDRCILTCTREATSGYDNRRVDEAFLKENLDDFNQYFYVCGPKKFVSNINSTLEALGANSETVVFER